MTSSCQSYLSRNEPYLIVFNSSWLGVSSDKFRTNRYDSPVI